MGRKQVTSRGICGSILIKLLERNEKVLGRDQHDIFHFDELSDD